MISALECLLIKTWRDWKKNTLRRRLKITHFSIFTFTLHAPLMDFHRGWDKERKTLKMMIFTSRLDIWCYISVKKNIIVEKKKYCANICVTSKILRFWWKIFFTFFYFFISGSEWKMFFDCFLEGVAEKSWNNIWYMLKH